jgi:hypothetical protein
MTFTNLAMAQRPRAFASAQRWLSPLPLGVPFPARPSVAASSRVAGALRTIAPADLCGAA